MCMCCCVYALCVPSVWQFNTIGRGTHGRSFGDILPAVQAELRDLIPNIRIQPAHNIVVMAKGEAVAVTTKDNGERGAQGNKLTNHCALDAHSMRVASFTHHVCVCVLDTLL